MRSLGPKPSVIPASPYPVIYNFCRVINNRNRVITCHTHSSRLVLRFAPSLYSVGILSESEEDFHSEAWLTHSTQGIHASLLIDCVAIKSGSLVYLPICVATRNRTDSYRFHLGFVSMFPPGTCVYVYPQHR